MQAYLQHQTHGASAHLKGVRDPIVSRSAPRRLRRIAPAAAGSHNAQADYIEGSNAEAFRVWAQQAGIAFPRLKPATFDGLRGLAASQAIATDDLVLSVPRAAAITLGPKQRCPFPDFVKPEFWGAPTTPWFLKLALMLLHERRQGSASRLAEYIKQLPQTFDSPVNWSQECVQQLQYPYLMQKVREQQQEWADLHARVSTSGLAPGATRISRAELFWAICAVRSRTFSGPYVPGTVADRVRLAALVGMLVIGNTLLTGAELGKSLGAAVAVLLFNVIYEVTLAKKLRQYAMCPVIDLLNHSSMQTAEVSYNVFRDAFSVAVARPYSPGQQVFVSYGRQSNDSLMQFYGFSEPGNPADTYTMTGLLHWMAELAPMGQQKLDALKGAGLLGVLQEVSLTREGFAPSTLQALRFLLAPEAEATAKGPAGFSGPGDADVEARVALVLVHAVERELASLGSSLEEDLAALEGSAQHTGRVSGGGSDVRSSGSSSSRGVGFGSRSGSSRGEGGDAQAELALRFRVEKKKVLMACLAALQGKAGSAAAAAQPQAMPEEAAAWR